MKRKMLKYLSLSLVLTLGMSLNAYAADNNSDNGGDKSYTLPVTVIYGGVDPEDIKNIMRSIESGILPDFTGIYYDAKAGKIVVLVSDDVERAKQIIAEKVNNTAPSTGEKVQIEVVESEGATPGPPQFSDVRDSLFVKDIEWAAEQGIVQGWADGSFRPYAPISREAFLAMLHRSIAPAEKPKTLDCFNDIADSYFKKDICWAKEKGIAKGYKDGSFRPLETIERGAVAAFFARAYSIDLPEYYLNYLKLNTTISDVRTYPFKKEVVWFRWSGLSTGYSDGSFRPNDPVTREAITAFLHRIDTRKQKGLLNHYLPDPEKTQNTPNTNYLDTPVTN